MNEKEFQVCKKRAELFLPKLKERFFLESRTLNAEFAHCVQPVAYKDRLSLSYVPVKLGEKFAEQWDSAWFHLTGEIPAEWADQPVSLRLNLGGESLIFDEKGVPLCGLTNTSIFNVNYQKEYLHLLRSAKAGEKINLWAEVGINGLFGEDEVNLTLGICKYLTYGVFNRAAWDLANDFEVLYSLLDSIKEQNARAVQLCMALNRAVAIFADDPRNAEAAREPLLAQLAHRATDSELTTVAVGHAHIDVGWLWPVRESIRKSARTFSSQLYNMEQYPDYVFGASQPQLYEFVKDHYPELFAKIKERVAEGRWELQGGMWVEADCNIISGESMVRQFLCGKNFFRDEFGVEVKNLWLPDVFGYSAAMPQIIKKSGCDFFLTQKISWSQFNKFPYHSFFWRGLDNTEVLTHFPPEDNYNSALWPERLNYARNNFNENYFLPEFMTLFGIGDGGGGPRQEHIEFGLRTADLEGCPKVKFGRADAFFQRLESHAAELPTWVGELYLELHRGTLTTQSRTKRNNRKCEQLLAMTEFLCSCLPTAEYPAAQLDRLWKKVLCNQFHDIIPGSSIRKVYEVTEREHAEVIAACNVLIEEAAAKLLEKDENCVSVLNTLSYDYTSPVELPASWAGCQVRDAAGNALLTQSEEGKLWVLGNFPAQSFTVLTRGEAVADDAAAEGDSLVLENELVRYEFDANARLIAAFDKTTNRDVICGAVGNVLNLYVDEPVNWDAWDVDFTYRQGEPVAAEGVKAMRPIDGPVRQKLEFSLTVGHSTIHQQVVLAANSKRLDFVTDVDWHEKHRMLRVSFPTTVCAAEASCDIQYGFIRRPTHTNTSWDFARFEVAAHRYVDLSDVNGGAALLNDCKYGYHLEDNTLDLNLLRSPLHPDPQADQGEQHFTYSFLPHAGGLVGSEVMQEAACLNRAPAVLAGRAAVELPTRLIDGEGVSLEVLKKAEKENCRVIRLVETNGCNSHATLKVAASELVETNLIEWEEGAEVAVLDGLAEVTLKPFEIKTFKLK